MSSVANNINGYTTTAATSFAAIRATTYTEQTTNAQRSVKSSDANDTSGGTGARTIRITYFDQNMAGPFTEDLTMNGTSAVNTASNTICFIESLVVLTCGSQLGNVGTITLFAATAGGGGAVWSIAAGDNQTQGCHHYITTGVAARVMEIYAGIKGTVDGSVHLRKGTPTVANTPEQVIAPVMRAVSGGGSNRFAFTGGLKVIGPARLTLYAKPDAATSTDWLAGFGILE